MREFAIGLLLAFSACSNSNHDYVMSTDELHDRLAAATCERRVRCGIMDYDECLVDMTRLFNEYEIVDGWPEASLSSQMDTCEAFIASAQCGRSVWLAEECDFGQQY